MKKRNLFLTIALAFVLCFAAAACSNLGSFKVQGTQNYDYIVLSNGGSAVQYGNYIYFLNGHRSYNDDDDAKQNVFKKVEKGGVYRAELEGTTPVEKSYSFSFGTTTQKTFEPIRNTDTRLNIKGSLRDAITGYEVNAEGEYLKDDDGEYLPITKEVFDADVERIAPKLVGTSAYGEGGIFIFDNYLFYASPSNKKDKSGNTQVEKTEFYMAKLDGSQTRLVYTTKNPSTSSPYMFYKFNGSYYLVVLDGTNAISVKMGKKISKPITLAKDVSELYLPNKGVYYKGMPENTIEDFVYILRSPTKGDPSRIGNILEMKRPDGSTSHIISANGRSSSITGSDNGTFFYGVDNAIKYSNFAYITNGLLDDNGDVDSNATLPSGVKSINGNFSPNPHDTFDVVTFIHPNPQNFNDVFALASNTTGLYLIDAEGNETKLYESLATIVKAEGNFAYFTAAVKDKSGATFNALMRVDMFGAGNVEVILNTDTVNADTPFTYDILADFVVYFADIEDIAPAYTFFRSLDETLSLAEVAAIRSSDINGGTFIGSRIESETVNEDDLYPEEDEE